MSPDDRTPHGIVAPIGLDEMDPEEREVFMDLAAARGVVPRGDRRDDAAILAAEVGTAQATPTRATLACGTCPACSQERSLQPPLDRLLLSWRLLCGCGPRDSRGRELSSWLEEMLGVDTGREAAAALRLRWAREGT